MTYTISCENITPEMLTGFLSVGPTHQAKKNI